MLQSLLELPTIWSSRRQSRMRLNVGPTTENSLYIVSRNLHHGGSTQYVSLFESPSSDDKKVLWFPLAFHLYHFGADLEYSPQVG